MLQAWLAFSTLLLAALPGAAMAGIPSSGLHANGLNPPGLISCLSERIRKVSLLKIVDQTDDGFHNASYIRNLYTRKNFQPQVIVFPESTEDVEQIVKATQACRDFLPAKATSVFSVLSGGHNYAGYCLSNGIVVNMEKMNTVHWDFPKRQVTVGMGVRWRDIYPHIEGTGLIAVGGGCPDVGVGGFVLGGGWSWMSRSYGLGSDNLLEADVVLANGQTVTVNDEIVSNSRDTHLADLWFSLRGAGGGNFGIVTRMVLQLRQLRTNVGLNGQVCWTLDRAKEPLNRYKDWLLTKPFYFGAPVILSNMFGERRYCITVVHNGDPEEGFNLLQPMFSLMPDYVSLARNDLSTFEVLMDGNGASTNDAGRTYTNSLIIMKENFTSELVDVLIQGVNDGPNQKDTIVFHEGGGYFAAVPSNATAFPYRDLFVVIQVNAIWDSDGETSTNVAWADTLVNRINKFSSGSYVNYMNGKMKNQNVKYYGSNLPRIQRTKDHYDPSNLFAFPSGIDATPGSGTASNRDHAATALGTVSVCGPHEAAAAHCWDSKLPGRQEWAPSELEPRSVSSGSES